MWHPKTFWKHRGEAVTAEAERLLSGRTYDEEVARRRFVRAWTVVSALAHCDRDRLLELQSGDPSLRSRRWSAVLAYLATELAIHAPTDADLVRIQREVLVPLELDLLDPVTMWIGSPTQLVDEVSADLGWAGWPSDL